MHPTKKILLTVGAIIFGIFFAFFSLYYIIHNVPFSESARAKCPIRSAPSLPAALSKVTKLADELGVYHFGILPYCLVSEYTLFLYKDGGDGASMYRTKYYRAESIYHSWGAWIARFYVPRYEDDDNPEAYIGVRVWKGDKKSDLWAIQYDETDGSKFFVLKDIDDPIATSCYKWQRPKKQKSSERSSE